MRFPLPLLAAELAVLSCAASTHAQCTERCTALHTLFGEAAGDQFGWVSNELGDLTGDGICDFILTAPTNDGGGANAGRIYVYDGATADELWRSTGSSAGWRLGHDATTAGDVTGDGIPDVIAGAPSVGAGRVVICDGTDGSVITTITGGANGDEFGFRVMGGGDFDGDGTSDLVVGAPGSDIPFPGAGRVLVYSGVDFSLICAINGRSANDRFGSGVAFVGDLDGDGRDDIAIGAQNAGSGSGLGYAYRWTGTECAFLFGMSPGAPASNLGLWFMNGGHDVNRDGVPDIYINDFGANRAHIFSGVNGVRLWSLNGNGEGGGFGIGRLIEDIDGDCHADMILCAWASSVGAPNAGKAFIYSGRTGAVLDTYTHDVAGAGFGFDANGMGDVNGDGAFDYLITAASDLGARGVAYVIAGEIQPPATGDLTGDGSVAFDDLILALGTWGPCADPPEACPADLDCDGTIGFGDLVMLLANWS